MIEHFDPIAMPLWATLAFAVSMYPLGFFMTDAGCTCCGRAYTFCTQCGTGIPSPYAAGPGVYPPGQAAPQDAYGRMCCSAVTFNFKSYDYPTPSPTVPSSITLRITSTGPASTTLVFTSTVVSGSFYKATYTVNCKSIEGDYVLPLARGAGVSCAWGMYPSDGATGITLYPVESGAHPSWKAAIAYNLLTSVRRRLQTCTIDADGIVSCTVGTNPLITSYQASGCGGPGAGGAFLEALPVFSSTYSSENCSLAGVAVGSVQSCVSNIGTTPGFSIASWPTGWPLSGCIYSVTVV